nr:8906_t:CDS:2 [Entrophospora candida]
MQDPVIVEYIAHYIADVQQVIVDEYDIKVTVVKVKLKNNINDNSKIVNPIPSAHIFTIFIIKFTYGYEDIPIAINVYETMLKYNILPNVVKFTILIETSGMLDELEKEGIKPERATYKVLKHINNNNIFPRTLQKIKDAIYWLDLVKNVDIVYELYKNFIRIITMAMTISI